MYVYVCMCICIYVQVYVDVYIHTHLYMYLYVGLLEHIVVLFLILRNLHTGLHNGCAQYTFPPICLIIYITSNKSVLLPNNVPFL